MNNVIDRAAQDRLTLCAHVASGEINLASWTDATIAEVNLTPAEIERFDSDPERRAQLEYLWLEMAGGIVSAPLVVAESDFCLLIELAAIEVPSAGLALQPADFLMPMAFVWFEEPFPTATARSAASRPDLLPGIHAVLWLVGPEGGYRIWTFGRDGRGLVTHSGFIWNHFGELDGQPAAAVPLCTPLLLNERLARRARTKASRGVMRRTTRQKVEPEIQIVRLRQERQLSESSDTRSAARHWDHRWIVRGHWRNQWYPSTEEHRSKWIPAHVKGPDDAPLKAPKRVYLANR